MIDCWVCVECIHFLECNASACCDDVFEQCESCLTGQHCRDNCYQEEVKENDK